RGFTCVVMRKTIHVTSTTARHLSSLPSCWIGFGMRSVKSCSQTVCALPQKLLMPPRPHPSNPLLQPSSYATSIQIMMQRLGNRLPMSPLQLGKGQQQGLLQVLLASLVRVSGAMLLARVAAAKNTSTATGVWPSYPGSNQASAPAECSGGGQKMLDVIL